MYVGVWKRPVYLFVRMNECSGFRFVCSFCILNAINQIQLDQIKVNTTLKSFDRQLYIARL